MHCLKHIVLSLLFLLLTISAQAHNFSPLAQNNSNLANLPSLGDAESGGLSPAVERRLGEYIMRSYRSAGLVFEDRETLEYLQILGAKIVAASPGSAGIDFEFFLVNDPTLNAFALPGGFIGVHTGLIFAARTESELASVLAHEVGHVTQRHIARSFAKQKQSNLAALAAMALAMMASRDGQGLTGAIALGSTIGAAQTLGFSREAEREADRVGYQALQAAGFDTRGMVSFFERLQQGSRLYEGNAPVYLRTHPLTSERIADIRNRLPNTLGKLRSDTVEFQLIRSKMRILRDLSVDGLKAALTFFSKDAAQVGLNHPVVLEYGQALVYARQNDWERAQQCWRTLNSLNLNGLPMLDRLGLDLRLGRLVYEAGKSGLDQPVIQAPLLDLAKAALDLHAKYPSRLSFAMLAIDILQKAGQHEHAIGLIREQLLLYSSELELFERLAQSQFALEKRTEHHLSLSKLYELQGTYSAALEQVQLAQKFVGGDFYLQSQIDVRRKFLEAKILDQGRNGSVPSF